MLKYGLRIGEVGLEFSTREDREKAIIVLTKCSSVNICDTGIRYRDSDGAFGTYERESKEIQANCKECGGVFSIETCPRRDYPKYNDWNKRWDIMTGHICDACLAKQKKAKEIADAKEKLGMGTDI